METILIINALLALVENLMPTLNKLRDRGDITVEKQKEISERYEKLKNNLDAEFGGSHWRIRPDDKPGIPILPLASKSPDCKD